MLKDYCCLNGDDPKFNLIDPDLFDIILGNRTIYEKLSNAHNNLKQGIKSAFERLEDSQSGLLNFLDSESRVYFLSIIRDHKRLFDSGKPTSLRASQVSDKSLSLQRYMNTCNFI